MDAELRQSMFQYYEERAPDYEEAYLLGTGTASIPDPGVFRSEAQALGRIVARMARGRIVDIACGTGFWLPFYASSATTVTLIDQSQRMLDECRRRVVDLRIEDRASLVRADVLEYSFAEQSFEFALVGFLLSHLTEAQERLLFDSLRRCLAPSGNFLILDSAWSPERSRFNAKVERQKRQLNDGSTFDIYKRYFDPEDVSRWETYGLHTSIEHFGQAFVAVWGAFGPAVPA
jgi:ubiquinone/menaquinone biosynthesis C-methylase UbiE